MDFTDISEWKSIPAVKGTLKVIVGNYLEVLSNGMYKSVFHRATPSPRLSRVYVASFLSLRMGETVEPAMELVDEEHPKDIGQLASMNFSTIYPLTKKDHT